MKNLAQKETFQNNIRAYELLYLAARKKVTLFFSDSHKKQDVSYILHSFLAKKRKDVSRLNKDQDLPLACKFPLKDNRKSCSK